MTPAASAPAAAASPEGAPPVRRSPLRGWRGPALAAMVAVAAGLPGLLAVPPLDRDESRFAEASAQMLESGDPVTIRFGAEPRNKKPVGIHWLQATSVALTSSPQARAIAAYRWPSLLGAALAAAACAWGAAAFTGATEAALAGAVLGACALLSAEAFIAKTDAVLCGATTLAMAALGRRYAAARGGVSRAGPGALAALWVGLALGVIVKGPLTPMVVGTALLALWGADRDAGWIRRLAWLRGLGFVALVCGPWAAAVTVATDGAFWTGAVGGDLAPKLAGGHEGHGAPPGVHTLLAPLLLFPATALLPGAVVGAWRGRREPGVRFALAWLLPSWAVFELLPTKLVHYPLPLYGALAWLCAFPVCRAPGRVARGTATALALAAGAAFAVLPPLAAGRYGGPDATPWALAAAALAAAAGVAGAGYALSRRPLRWLGAALGLGVAAHGVLAGAVLPRLDALWTSARAARALRAAGLDPRGGLTPGPVAAAGYAEPSLMFLLGTRTELAGPVEAARAVAQGRPAWVEARVDPAFRAALAQAGVRAGAAARVAGYDYSDGRPVALTLWRRLPDAGR